jgi:hypothetical protein
MTEPSTATRECQACGKATKGSRYCSRGCWIRSPERQAKLDRWRERPRAAGEPIDPVPPTPAEIAAECKAIREETWTEATYRERAPHWASRRWEVGCVPFSPPRRESAGD